MQYDIFISYKRRGVSSVTASSLYEMLQRKGYNVFLDRKEMRSGRFNEQLLEHINYATDIIILLEDGSLDSWFQNKDKEEFKNPGKQPPYKSDWFCKEIMHALSLPGKNIVPILLDGYKMPAFEDLPDEMKDLSFHNALTLEDGEVEMLFQKYLIGKEYLRSKPKNLALSRISASNDTVVGSFLICSDVKNFGVYEYGERIITLTDMNDIDHPFRYPVSFAGEHQFLFVNYDTGEEVRITKRIEANCQEYIFVKWTWTEELWELTEAKIKEQNDLSTLVSWGDILIKGNDVHKPDYQLSYTCMTHAIELMGEDMELVALYGPKIAEILSAINTLERLELGLDEEISVYRKLAQIDKEKYLPSLASSLSGYAAFHGHIGAEDYYTAQYDEALSIYDHLAENDSKYLLIKAAALRDYANSDLFNQNYKGAEAKWKMSLTIYEQEEQQDFEKCWNSIAGVYCDWAWSYDRRKDYESAATTYKKASEVCREKLKNPQGLSLGVHALREMIYALWHLKRFEQCEKEFGELIRIYQQLINENANYRKDLAFSFHNLAKCCFLQVKYEKAEKSFNEAIEIYRSLPDDDNRYVDDIVDAENALSYCYMKQNKFKEALTTIEDAIKLRPEDPHIMDSKGEFLLAMNREEEALDLYRQMIQKNENYFDENETDFYKGLKKRGLIE